MDLPEIIAIALICFCIGGAVFYIVRAKKRGQKCIGCPHGGKCGSENQGCSGCGCGCNQKENLCFGCWGKYKIFEKRKLYLLR